MSRRRHRHCYSLFILFHHSTKWRPRFLPHCVAPVSTPNAQYAQLNSPQPSFPTMFLFCFVVVYVFFPPLAVFFVCNPEIP